MNEIRFIAGSGRSGTTWILDALASANKLRPVFEPLHPYLSEVGERYAHRALSPDEEHPELQEFLVSVCSGRGPRLWTQFRHQRRWLLPTVDQFWSKNDAGRTKRHWTKFLSEFPRMAIGGFRRRPIIKCIRANLMLPWIARQLGCRIVLVIRHPGAVVESELRANWNPQFALERFRNDARLHELTQGRYKGLLRKKLQLAEALTLRWVIENQWAIEMQKSGSFSVFYYEHLRAALKTEWPSLVSALGLEHIPNMLALSKPSQQSNDRRQSISTVQSDTPMWMRRLPKVQSEEVQRILSEVGLLKYSVDSPNPSAHSRNDVPFKDTHCSR